MVDVAMFVIPEPGPGERTVLTRGQLTGTAFVDQGPYFVGEEEVNYVCGECSLALAAGLSSTGQLETLVLRCPRCGAFNETR